MRPFTLRFEFRTPLIASEDGLSLDAILLGELALRVGDDAAAEMFPTILAHTDGVPHASRGFFRYSAGFGGRDSVTKIFNAGREYWMAELPDPSISGRRGNEILPPKNANAMNCYESRAVRQAWFCGVGDIEQIEILMADVVGIGKLRNTGYGQIRGDIVIAADDDADPQTCGLMGQASRLPVRAVPDILWHKLNGRTDAMQRLARARPPYWSDRTPVEWCVVPGHDDEATAIAMGDIR